MPDRPSEDHHGTPRKQCRGRTEDKSTGSRSGDEPGEGIGGSGNVVVGRLVLASRLHHKEYSSTESTSFTQIHE